jgi:hypothetical protein
MNRIKIFAILGLFAFFFNILAAQEEIPQKQQHESVLGNRKPKTVSEKKVQKMEDVIYNYINNGSDIKNEQVKAAIISDIRELYPISSNEKPLNVNIPEIRKDTNYKSEKEFPLMDKELTEKYAKEADDIFKPVLINSVITITYKQGPYTKTITGRYFGLTYYNDGVKIENSVVPIFDLSDIDKSKFDDKLRVIKKNEYVSSKIADYVEQKKIFAEKTVREKMDSIVKQNEKGGFIFIWNKWLTPENVANVLITHIIDSSNRRTLEPVFDAEKKKTEDGNTEDNSK